MRRLVLALILLGLFLPLPRVTRRSNASNSNAEQKIAKSLIIVTTSAIRSASAKLGPFIEAKEQRGFTVLVGTEDDYGGHQLVGRKRADKIRKWLRDLHEGYSFVLLIGDPHPDYGDVPMVRVWPRHSYSETECGGFALDCRSLETDYLYADLTGDWDLNANGKPGEHTLDDGEGGIDFEAELIVGRLPVNLGEVADLDRILDTAIRYMSQPKEQTAYRRRILFPAALYYLRGQQMTTYAHMEDVDGARVPEWLIHNHLKESEITYTRMYEQEGHQPSNYHSDLALTRENLLAEWSKGYGMVFWFAHGLPDRVSRVIWEGDSNDNQKAEADEILAPTLIYAEDMDALPGDRPGFVVASSCEVGSVENLVNLTHRMLVSGAAVGVVSSTSVTPGGKSDWEDLASTIQPDRFGSDTLGVYLFRRLIAGGYPAKSVVDAKATAGTSRSIESYAGKMMLNYYGDPTLTLNDSLEDLPLGSQEPEEEPVPGAAGCGA